MSEALELDCAQMHVIVDRLARYEELSDEETAQLIIHTHGCEGCKLYLAMSFKRETENEVQSERGVK